MEKKIFNISGFDCANCAAHAEKHIANHKDVEYAHLDFAGNKLYITFKGETWDVDKLASIIEEVEDDPLDISEYQKEIKKETILFNKKMWWQLIRVVFAFTVTLVCVFLLGNPNLSWLRFTLYAITNVVIGYDIFYKVFLHIKNRTNILDHYLLILLAAIGSISLAIISLVNNEQELIKVAENYYFAFDHAMESVLVMALFQIGSIVESVASNKSKNAITSAVQLRVNKANLIKGEEIIVVEPEELSIGDNIIVKTGEMIPVDGVIYDGDGFIDTSSLTGEYVPIHAKEKQEVYSGCLLKSGTLYIKVKRIYKDSAVSKVLELITSGSEKKSRADEFIDRFAKWYTPAIMITAVLVFVIGGAISQNWLNYLHVGLEILVVGCPCSVVISVPLAYFSGIGLASKNGVVVKGANYLDELSRLGLLVTDKTGTLTEGSFKITKIVPNGISEEELLNNLYAVECLSTHPIGKAICHDVDTNKLKNQQKDFEEIAGFGCKTRMNDKLIIAGNAKLMKQEAVEFEVTNEVGTIIYCAINNQYVGYVILNDTIKEEVKELVSSLHKESIEVLLLTGDHEENAKQICADLGIDRYQAELVPEDKAVILEKEMENQKKAVAFVGDGINDAPSIKRSDIGIAMGGIGSDIAVENADIVIMNDDPNKITTAIKISKKTRNTAIFNIAFALFIKIAVATLAIIFPHWSYMMYVAVLADTGLTVLLVINSLLLLYRKIK